MLATIKSDKPAAPFAYTSRFIKKHYQSRVSSKDTARFYAQRPAAGKWLRAEKRQTQAATGWQGASAECGAAAGTGRGVRK